MSEGGEGEGGGAGKLLISKLSVEKDVFSYALTQLRLARTQRNEADFPVGGSPSGLTLPLTSEVSSVCLFFSGWNCSV